MDVDATLQRPHEEQVPSRSGSGQVQLGRPSIFGGTLLVDNLLLTPLVSSQDVWCLHVSKLSNRYLLCNTDSNEIVLVGCVCVCVCVFDHCSWHFRLDISLLA